MSDTRKIKAKAEQDFLSGDTMKTIAIRYGISTKTLQRWANEGAWRDKPRVVNIAQPSQFPRPADLLPVRRKALEVNELEIVDLALSDLSAVLGSGAPPATLGSIASGLCRLIELRLKLKPKTAAEVADLALGLGITPAEFTAELKQRWQQRA